MNNQCICDTNTRRINMHAYRFRAEAGGVMATSPKKITLANKKIPMTCQVYIKMSNSYKFCINLFIILLIKLKIHYCSTYLKII